MKIYPVTNRVTPQIRPKQITFTSARLEQKAAVESFSLLSKLKKLFFPAKIETKIAPALEEKPLQKVVKPIIDNNKIIELEKILDNPLLLEEFFASYPDINLNSKDSYGDTILLRAVRRANEKNIKLLKDYDFGKYGSVDWNAVDSKGNNAPMILLDKYPYRNGFHEITDVEVIMDILFEKADPTYINPQTKRTLIQDAIVRGKRTFIRDYLHKYRNNSRSLKITHPDTPPVLFLAFQHNVANDSLLEIVTRSNLDETYKGKTIFEFIDAEKMGNLDRQIISILERHSAKKRLEKIKDYYQKEGIINLQQLIDYIDQPAFSSICNESINDIGEDVGHFITELYPKNYEEIKQISDLIDKLQQKGYSFAHTDDLGRTAIVKAIEGNNTKVLKFLLNKIPQRGYGYIKDNYYDNIEKLLKEYNITDETVLKIFQKKNKETRRYY